MKVIRQRRDRRGMHVLGAVLGCVLVALMLGLVQGRRTMDMLRWGHRIHGELALEDLLTSAVEEATQEVMADANVPGTAVFDAFRKAGDITISPRLDHTRTLWNDVRAGRDLVISAAVIDRKAHSASLPAEVEGQSLLVIDARARGEWPGSPVMTVRQVRQIRQALITPPPPVDTIVQYLPGGSANDGAVLPEDLNLDHWISKASLTVGPGPDVHKSFKVLTDRLGMLNGVIFVDVPAGQTLRLVGLRFKGKAVLVVRGHLVLDDVRVEDPRQDLLTIMAFGDVDLAGTIEAALILTHAPGTGPVRRRVLSQTRLIGTFVLTQGNLEGRDPVELVPEPLRYRVGPSSGGILPDRIYVSVSPVLSQKGVFVR